MKKVLQLFRLRQINNGVFIKLNKATISMLRICGEWSDSVREGQVCLDPNLGIGLPCWSTGADAFKLSIKMKLKLLKADTESLRFEHAVSKWGLVSVVGCFLDQLNEAAPVWLVPLENQLLPVWPLAENRWREGWWYHVWNLGTKYLRSDIWFKVNAGFLMQSLSYILTFLPLLRALHHLGNSQPQVCARAGVQAWFRQGGLSC